MTELDFIIQGGAISVLAIAVWLILSKIIPMLVDRFSESLKQQQEVFSITSRAQSDLFSSQIKEITKEANDGHRAIVEQLHSMTQEIRQHQRDPNKTRTRSTDRGFAYDSRN